MSNEDRQRGNEPGPVSATVAENIAARRAELGWSRRELAEQLSKHGRRFTASSVQKLETNERRVDVDDLMTLCTVLDLDVTELLGLGKAARRSTLRELHGLRSRNPLLTKALQISVIELSEPRPLLLDYVDNAARNWPAWSMAFDSWREWIDEVAAANDEQAAAMILTQWAEDGIDEVPDEVGLATIVGSDRAAKVRAAMLTQKEAADDGEG